METTTTPTTARLACAAGAALLTVRLTGSLKLARISARRSLFVTAGPQTAGVNVDG